MKRQLLWVQLEIPIPTIKENIWSALTVPSMTKEYMFNCALECAWNIGDEVAWVETKDDGSSQIHVQGRLVEYSPYERLRFTIFHHKANRTRFHSELQFLITAHSQGSLLTIRQGDFAAFPEAEETYLACKNGWDQVKTALKETCLSIP